jgi:hypothetical protein
MRSVLIFVLALLPVSRPYSLPARQARLPRAVQRARCVALQEVEPDEYIPPLDVDAIPEKTKIPGFERRFSEGTGPYTVSHGVPMNETDRNPPFLTDQDWHISGSYDLEKIEEIKLRQQAEIDAIARSELDERIDPFATKEYMQLEFGEPSGDWQQPHIEEPKSATPMPSSWQEFQFLQQSVAKYARASDALPVPAADIADAEDLGEKLSEIYPTFKNIISEGWEFVFDPDVEQAGVFVKRMRKWEQGLGGKKRAQMEWELEGEAQPYIGENKQE